MKILSQENNLKNLNNCMKKFKMGTINLIYNKSKKCSIIIDYMLNMIN